MPNPFEYVKPNYKQVSAIQQVRVALATAYDVLLKEVPDGPYRTLAVRKLEEASMWANKAIVFDGGSAPG